MQFAGRNQLTGDGLRAAEGFNGGTDHQKIAFQSGGSQLPLDPTSRGASAESACCSTAFGDRGVGVARGSGARHELARDGAAMMSSTAGLKPFSADDDEPLIEPESARAVVSTVASYVVYGSEVGDPCFWCESLGDQDPMTPG